MKSTIKIDYEGSRKNSAIIKIVVPYEEKNGGETPGFNEDQVEDVRDKLISDFLHTPYQVDKNTLFELKTHYPISGGHVTTIGPILNESLFYRFRGHVLNTFIPYEDLRALNSGENSENVSIESKDNFKRINGFFDWVDTLKWCGDSIYK